MLLQFHIHYRTVFGEQIIIRFHIHGEEQIHFCQTYDGENWTGSLNIQDIRSLSYQYGIDRQGNVEYEGGTARFLTLNPGIETSFVQDYWRVQKNPLDIFNASAFTDIIFQRPAKKSNKKLNLSSGSNFVRFQIYAPDVPSSAVMGVTGNIPELGSWKEIHPMQDDHYPLWSVAIPLSNASNLLEYKYILIDAASNQILEWEEGGNRQLQFAFPSGQGNEIVRNDLQFRRNEPWWRGAGLAIPIFSLRSELGFGIGEFPDLLPLIDFTTESGLRVIQTLPVNDTIATQDWKSSYPYAAISVHALHPLYINLESIGSFNDPATQKGYEQDRQLLNTLGAIDFPTVLEKKIFYLRELYKQEFKTLEKEKGFKDFIKRNASWLYPYAAFSHLRDLYGTPDYNRWPEHRIYSDLKVREITNPKSATYPQIAFYLFVQYHADRQLKAAKEYGKSRGVVLKGDLPIGVYRHSCDAWVAPELYNMNAQAGAPPDDYAVLGQNWGFPTYNWEVMAKNGFAWWRERMQKLSEYFDALRIDHILGFFRIWQIPLNQVEGTMGSFNPCLPYTEFELRRFGVHGDLTRFTEPYIRDHYLPELFGEDTSLVKEHYLTNIWEGAYTLKDHVNDQLKIKNFFSIQENKPHAHLAAGLSLLVSEILLIPVQDGDETQYNPRITLQTTYSYKALDHRDQEIFTNIYNEYYFRRHNDFWKEQAYWKLPALLDATRMLICGEDLGMIPASVPGVMKDLNIISLEIQRMPKGAAEFGDAAQYPYWSVCSPSCHDMSTIRGWWEGNPATAQHFYSNYLHQPGAAPQPCPTDIVEAIDRDHLLSPSLLAIFPLQDLVGMDKNLRRNDVPAEQINDPSNPNQHWKYRFHLKMEDLKKESGLIRQLKNMLVETGRLH
ncbi:MAG: 4-alpha-glucanotransferase [Saprospiraceae bacterium]|nr:4-alpha-glucanotransferase [Saprospiraceae bacterium]MCB9319911.1 4-alpha-glucanotransferase [Lewinellaceae bacterium]